MILFFKPLHPIGGGTIELSKINDADVATLDKEFLELTYSDRERCETAAFVPDHVSLDKKVLHFKGSGSTFYTVLYSFIYSIKAKWLSNCIIYTVIKSLSF